MDTQQPSFQGLGTQLASLLPQAANVVQQQQQPVISPQVQQMAQQPQQQSQSPMVVSPYQESSQLDPNDSWGDFVRRATRVAQAEDYPVSVLLGQAALESGRGNSAPGNNFFGLKGIGNAGQNVLATQEYGQNGYYGENSGFAAFQTPEDSMRAYINLIKDNYQNAYAKRSDPMAMLQEIKNGGYATDPTYVQQVSSMPEFQQFAGQGGNQ